MRSGLCLSVIRHPSQCLHSNRGLECPLRDPERAAGVAQTVDERCQCIGGVFWSRINVTH